MRTRSQSRNNFPQQEASPAIVEPLRIELPFLEDQFQEDPPEYPPEVPMDDNRTMAELLQAPTEGYEDAIVIPEIAANNFELKHRAGTLPGNTITNPKEDLKGITTQSGVAYQGPTFPTPSKVVKQGIEVTKDQVQTPSSQSTTAVQPSVTQSKTPVSEPVVAPVSALMPNLKPLIPYPSRRDNERRRDQANKQIEKFYEIFKDMSFEISFTDALILMPKFASTLKALIGNKEKLSEMARTPMNEHCPAVILNKLPTKLGDPGKFLIPCEFPGMDECLALADLGMDECLTLADLGASINLMPLSVWEGLALPELTLTCMTLELADRSVSKAIGIAKDVSVKVGVFHFPADFVVVDFEPNPRVPLIIGRCYLLNDYEDVGKLKAKGDTGVFVGYSKESAAFRIYNKRTRKIYESVNVNFDEISKMAAKQFSLEPDLSNLNETGKSLNPSVSKVSEASKKDLEDLFQNFYDEYFDSLKIMKSSTTNVETSINEEVFHEVSESFQGESLEDPPEDPPEVLMADNRTMAELLQAPTEGYEDAIVIPEIAGNNFELKHDLVTKFINQFFPLSKITNLHNEITRFQQRFDESFYEAWDRFNDLLRACPHHGFFELHQLDTLYNALNVNDQDSLKFAAGGNFLDKMPQECLKIIKSKSKVRQSRAKAVIDKVSTSSSTPSISSEVSEFKDMVRALLLDKKNQSSAPTSSSTHAPVKAVEPNCVTCSGTHSYQNCPATSGNIYRDNIQEYVSQAAAANYNQGNTGFRPQMVVNQPLAYQAPAYQAPIPQTQNVSKTDFESYVKDNDAVLRNMQNQGQNLQIQMANLMDMLSKFVSYNTASSSGSGTLPSNTTTNPKEDLKGITTRIGVSYQGPTISSPSEVVKQRTEVTKDQVQTPSSQSTVPVQPLVIQSETQTPVSEPVVAPVCVPKPNLKPFIPYPSRRNNERRRDQANEQIDKFYKIFKDMSFEISFMDALILMPKFASTLKALIENKEKLSEMARTPINEHCSAVILNKLPRKLGDPGKFLIPCEFPGMDECLSLVDLGASINLMSISMWEGLSLPELTSTCMILELADRSVSKPIGITKDVSVKVGVFHFPADFVVVDFEPGPPSPLNSREEADAFLGLEDDPNSSEFNPFYYDPEGDILLLEAILNSEPLPPLPNHKQYMPSYKKELKVCEAKTVKSSVDEPPEVKLKDLHPHLEYTFLEGENKLPVIIGKEFGDEEKSALIKVLKSHKRAIAWKLSDIQEVEKLLDAGLIYPISDSPWVSPIHYIPKKGGFTVVENEENELIPTRLVSEWQICIDYRKLNEATPKDHFPLPFMDQMLERLAGNEYYYFLDGFFGYFQIPIDPVIRRKQRLPVHTTRLPIDACPSVCAMHRARFKDKMLQRCEDTNLSLNWEKSHFMVKEGIVLGYKFSKNGIEVDKAKVDVIAKLPHPTTVKAYRTPIGCTPYKLVYEKACHLPIELEHKAYWALKQGNFDLTVVGDHRKDCSDCKVSRAPSFCLSFTRASHPQLHFGNPSWSISITFRFSVGIQTPDDLSRSQMGFIEKMGIHG
nr:hypothetical protein [Tanacetum cinerariifolium]